MTGAETIKVLVAVDCARPKSGPHRNVVSSLNALSRRKDVQLTLLTESVKEDAAFFSNIKDRIFLGFCPHKISAFLTNVVRLHRLAKKHDIVYVPTGLKTLLVTMAAVQGTGIRLIAGPNVRGLPFFMRPDNAAPFLQWGCLDQWIENSRERQQKRLEKGLPKQKVAVVSHGVDLSEFHPAKRQEHYWSQWNIPEDAVVLLHVGRSTEAIKGTKMLVRAFLEAARQRADIQLVLAGEHDSIRDEFEHERQVHFVGWQDSASLAVMYASSDLFIGSSVAETFWLTPLEAMASGVPVLTTPAGQTRTMITQQGREGWIVPVVEGKGFSQQAEQQMAAKISQATQDKMHLRQMGKAARQQAEKMFSEERIGKDLVAAFKQSLQNT